MDVDTNDEAAEVPSSSTSKGDKKRFEVKKVSTDWQSKTELVSMQIMYTFFNDIMDNVHCNNYSCSLNKIYIPV